MIGAEASWTCFHNATPKKPSAVLVDYNSTGVSEQYMLFMRVEQDISCAYVYVPNSGFDGCWLACSPHKSHQHFRQP